jgi:hypothetical protein
VLEERGEASDHATLRQRACDPREFVERHSRLTGTRRPRVGPHFLHRELALERLEHPPLDRRELDERRVDHLAGFIAPTARFHALPPHMAHSESEQALRRHGLERVGADPLLENLAMLLDREPLRDLERRPQPIGGARRRSVGRADDDVPGERIFPKEEVEAGVETIRRDLPRHQRAWREARRHERLPDAPDRSGREHGPQAFDHGVDVDPRLRRDLRDRVGQESRDAVLRDGEDPGIDGIVDLYGNGCGRRHVMADESGLR